MKKGEHIYPQLWDKEWLRSQLTSGKTYEQIADIVGCSKASVVVRVRQHGLVGLSTAIRTSGRHYERPKSKWGTKEGLQELVDDGATLHWLSELFNCSVGTVRNRLAELGVEFPERSRREE